jgi:hydrogenase maturation protease
VNAPVLIAGIGNIFHGDDGFGVAVARRLAESQAPECARVMDVGIRGIDLCFALLEEREVVIFADAVSRGGKPGDLYLVAIEPGDIPELSDCELPNSHGLDPMAVLGLAKRMGARFGKLFLVGCEPLVLDREDTGEIGLSDAVADAVDPAIGMIRDLVAEFEARQKGKKSSYAVF